MMKISLIPACVVLLLLAVDGVQAAAENLAPQADLPPTDLNSLRQTIPDYLLVPLEEKLVLEVKKDKVSDSGVAQMSGRGGINPDMNALLEDILSEDPANDDALQLYQSVNESAAHRARIRAGMEKQRWAVSVRIGSYQPDLTVLNNGLFQAPIRGRGQVKTDAEQTDAQAISASFLLNTQMTPVSIGAMGSIQVQRDISPRVSLLFGIDSWEVSTSSVTVSGRIPIQQLLTAVDVVRRGNLSMNAFHVGWRYNFLRLAKRYRFWTYATINEFYDVSYREDQVYLFKENDIAGFRRLRLMESHTAAVLAYGFGLGGEVFLTESIALGFDAGIIRSPRDFRLNNVTTKNDFLDTDDITFEKPPFAIAANGDLQYRSQDGASVLPIRLRLDGWQALVKLSFYF